MTPKDEDQLEALQPFRGKGWLPRDVCRAIEAADEEFAKVKADLRLFRARLISQQADRKRIEEALERVARLFRDTSNYNPKTNQPCGWCGASEGTFSERGFERCRYCGEPGQ